MAQTRAKLAGFSLPALVSYVVCCALATRVVVFPGPRFHDYALGGDIGLADVALAAVVLTQLPALRTIWIDRSRHWCAVAAGVLAVSLLPALVVHPSGPGVAAVLRWLGVTMFALGVGRLAASDRAVLLKVFAGVTAVQVLVALFERAGNGPVGLAGLGEPRNIYGIGGRYASSGLTVHPYVLAAWCVLAGAVLIAAVARGPRPTKAVVWATALPFAGVGLTMSRAGALAVVLVVACLALVSVRRRTLRILVVAVVVTSAFGAALDLSGWLDRASTTTASADAGSVTDVTSGRTQLIDQAWHLWKDSPFVGVGPGRYLTALEKRPDVQELATERPSRPVHVVPLLLLVEGGIVVFPALALIAWAVVKQTRRAGLLGLGITLAVLPFLFLDHLNWSYPQGLCLSAICLGMLDHLACTRRPAVC